MSLADTSSDGWEEEALRYRSELSQAESEIAALKIKVTELKSEISTQTAKEIARHRRRYDY